MRPPERVSARYYLREAMPLVLCGACLTVVLENSEKAKGIYREIVECYSLPDMASAFKKLEHELPRDRVRMMWNEKVEALKGRKSAAGEGSRWLVPDTDFFKGFAREASGYTYVFEEWLDSNRREVRSEDFERWYGLIEELIKVGFNREAEQVRGIYRVTAASSPRLFLAIHIRAFAEHSGVQLVDDGQTVAVSLRGRRCDLTDLLAVKGGSREHRVRTKACKSARYGQLHDDTIARKAALWYLCRVVYSGPEEFCNRMLFEDVDSLYRGNVSNEIKACDEATGYPRGP